MEAVEDTYVEAAILWLAQTILTSLFAGKLEAWLRQVGLADDTEKLKYEIERVETVVAAGKGRATGNKLLARCLCRLKELMYDADDVVDELDYYRLKHQVEGDPTACATEPESTDGHGAEQADGSRYNPDTMSSSGGKKRSKAWGEFRITEEVDGKPAKAECIHCHTVVRCETSKGTSVLHNHLKSDSCKRKRAAIEQTPNPSAGDGAQNGATVSIHDSDSRKRKRIDEASAHNTAANKNPRNKAEFCNRIEQTTNQLKEAISEVQKLYGSDSVASTNVCKNTAADPRRRTSSLVQRKMYGRLAEKDSIMKLMTEDKSDSVLVLPIVGIGGIGKTALAQQIYNDPTVKSQFDHRIWAWVSNNVDEVRLTREMLDFVSKEKHEGISSLAKLQEILESHVTSNRFLLILDDVWGTMDEHTWNKLLAPLKSDNAKGNVIIVTTRQISIAKRIGTVEPIKLGGLQDDDFWLLFRACAFGDDKYEGHPSLNIICRQIAKKLQGYPLAAETAGMLLREHLTIDHWSNILKNENWKSLKLNGGIMPALKLSYDYLPHQLQHCFRYCCLFPKDHHFGGAELVRIWISQGFVDGSRTSKSLEDTGNDYLAHLVNSSFFEQVKCYRHSQECFIMHGLLHDLAWQVSRAEFGTIDGCDREEILPTVRHLSIVTDSAFSHEKMEEKPLQVESVRKLRSLIVIGNYDPSFFRYFQNMFKQAENLRLLQISATYVDFVSFLHNLEYRTHLRYLKLENKGSGEALPISLSKFYHLEVLDTGHPTIVHGMNDLVSMRYLVVTKRAYSSVTSVGEMSNHQDVLNITDQNSSCSEITQLQSMNKLVQLGVFQLENVSSAEAYGPKLRDKQHLQKLHLFWNDTLSQDGYASDTSFEPFGDIETEEDRSPIDDINNDQSSEPSADTAREVLEGLEPHRNLKHLQISGYSGATSPGWLGTSVSCLQTLHLEDCGEWQILPSLGRLSFLTKLKLRKMQKVTELSIPSLEGLVLIEMPQLERCSCNSVRDFNSALRILKIQRCRVLKAFPLFESCKEHKIEKKSWLSHLSELTIHDCPHLTISNPLPPSSSGCKLSIARVSTLPTMKGSSNGKLIIGADSYDGEFDKDSDGLTNLDDKIVSFHNLRDLTRLQIAGCQNLSSISLEGFRQLISLRSLEIVNCRKLFSLVVLAEHTHEYMADANFIALPSLKHLSIDSCGITGMWLTVILKHVSRLEELHLDNLNISGLLIEGKESGLSHLEELSIIRCRSLTALEGLDSCTVLEGLNIYDCDSLTALEGLNCCTALEQLDISGCNSLTALEGLGSCTALERLYIYDCDSLTVLKGLDSCTALEELDIGSCNSLTALEGLQSLLKKLQIWENQSLKCLQLDSCTVLEELGISGCNSLTTLEGLDSCTTLEEIKINKCGSLTALEGLDSCTALERLCIYDCDSLTALEGLQSRLKKLQIWDNQSLKCLQLDSCTALEELDINGCNSLTALEGLQSLGGLRYLKLSVCPGLPQCLEHLSRQGYELYPQLERLQIDDYSFLTKSFCKHLTSLQRLQFNALFSQVTKLTDEQESALRLLTSLQELDFWNCRGLADLPVGLHSLPSLKRLKISNCGSISRLPQMGLPPTLEELDVSWCSDELSEQCRKLATSKLKVKIDY
ncbi:putative disease resistance protein RGA4 [Phragmites australis]|uniref:putative disease resistance protein RGA4 n=1 Tax=Phragmites australis TaxID=29695 RepID=UPI002D7929CA|nr:putative disease resistance protein RGA4 [Phragmites australis]